MFYVPPNIIASYCLLRAQQQHVGVRKIHLALIRVSRLHSRKTSLLHCPPVSSYSISSSAILVILFVSTDSGGRAAAQYAVLFRVFYNFVVEIPSEPVSALTFSSRTRMRSAAIFSP